MRIFVFLAAFFIVGLTQPALADITIGVSAPLAGGAVGIGEALLSGFKLAVADINIAGGIAVNGGSEKLKLEIMDDACTAKQAEAVAGKLIALKVAAVVSLSCNNIPLKLAEIYEKAGMPYIVPAISNPGLTNKKSTTLIRPELQDVAYINAAAAFVGFKFKGRKILVLQDGQNGARQAADFFKASVIGTTVDIKPVDPASEDFSDVIKDMQKAQYDLVVPMMLPSNAGLFLQQLGSSEGRIAVFGTKNLDNPDFINAAGDNREGAYFTTLHATDAGVSVMQKLNNPKLPVSKTLSSYSAAQIIAQALAKGRDHKAVVEALHSQTFQTVLGGLTFDEKGDAAGLKVDIMQYQGGKAVKIRP